MKIKESLNVTFDETPLPSKTSPLVDDDLDEEEAIKVTGRKNLENEIEDETLEIDEIVHIKEYMLVAQGYNQQEGIDYDETYAHVARLESIRILLAYVCALYFKSFQMDVKSAFLNGFINEEFDLSRHVDEFAKIMHDEFEMSMMVEFNFFLGLQIKQMKDGIFFNQSKYIKEMLKKFGLEDPKPMKTPMSSDTKLTKDEECESIDSTKYRGMIGSLLSLTASRPDIMFSVCLYAHFLKAPKTFHLEAVKRIFRYIKGTTRLGLWYPKETGIETVVYANSDHAGDYVDQKSISEDLDLLHEDLEQIDDVDIEEMDINWQIAMIAIRMKKFYKKTGRRVRIDGNKPVGFDKKKLECFKCHNTGHFARECTSKGTNDGKKRDSFYQDQGAGKKEQNQNCLLTMDDGVVNWGEHTVEEEETNHALMAISSNHKEPQKPEPSISDDKFSENSDTSNKEVMSEPKPKETEPSLQLNTGRENVNTGRVYVNSVRANVNSVRSNVNTGSFNINTDKAKQPINTSKSNRFSPDHPLKNMEDIGIFDNGYSGHMTGNKDHLDDFEECKGELFSPGVSFVKELGHFNLFLISQIYDKQHKILFTETECLVVSLDFKMPDENQIHLKVPRQHNMYSFDMKTPAPAKDYTCLIAKATSDESKLWHRRLEEFFTELQNLKTQENEAYSTGISEDTPEILTFRRELDELAPKHLSEVPKNKATSTTSVNSGSGPVNTQHADQDDSDMPELTIFKQARRKGFLMRLLMMTRQSAATFRSTCTWFIVYQIDVKSAFLYGTIDEEVYVSQPPGFVDPDHPKKVYKVVKALYGLHQAPRAWYATLSTFLEKHGYRRGTIDKTLFIKKDKKDIMLVQVYVDDIIFGSTRKSWCDEFEALMKGRFQMSSMGELIFFLGLQVKQKTDGIFISQDKYVADMLKKFDLASVKTAITPMETKMALTKDEEADEVDVHLYRSMIGSLMYLTASRPDIMFAVCACSRFQVTPKTSHLNAVKRIFKYLKGKPNLGLWYPRESSFDLEAFSDSDYARANLDRKSTTEAEYVAAASCCGQVLWIQNQMLDYGFNFMNTKIHIDNESTICIVKNPVYHSKTKHIEIRHHFIRDSYEKKLIRVEKIHTDLNVADLLTKADRWKIHIDLVVNIGMINP
ncbi:putative ribonuclease H-like domain-containing protein [Tanacetum coccineum]